MSEVETVYLCKGRESSKKDGKTAIVTSFDKLVAKGNVEREVADTYLEKIVTGVKAILDDADNIVEAVAENFEIRKDIFAELDGICKEGCYFTTNTSSLPINAIGEELSRPLAGMHFFNPAPVMKLVEVVVSEDTPQEMIDTLM